MLTLYGIPNCDTCRKARKWLDAHSVDYRFHDLRAAGLDRSTVESWAAKLDWQTLLNTRSTTWRGIPDARKKDLTTDKAMTLMLENPTLVKRPVAERTGEILVGFAADRYRDFFA